MDSESHTPRIRRARTNLLPLLPGLATQLKQFVDRPEMKTRHARRDDDGNWTIDEDIEAFLWYPGGPTQTCFWEVVRYDEALHGIEDRTTEYYQTEYYHVPRQFCPHRDDWQEENRVWVVVEVNNVQLEEWLLESGVLDVSNGILDAARETNEAIRNQHHDDMERG